MMRAMHLLNMAVRSDARHDNNPSLPTITYISRHVYKQNLHSFTLSRYKQVRVQVQYSAYMLRRIYSV
jgi:hypothetical protein